MTENKVAYTGAYAIKMSFYFFLTVNMGTGGGGVVDDKLEARLTRTDYK